MARRKKTVTDNENLSKETEKVQEVLLNDLVGDSQEAITPEKVIEAIDNSQEVFENKEVSEIQVVQKPKKEELQVGDRVKIKPNVETDTLGRRIHNGIRNYTYRVLAVRPDGFISIECLTYAFLVRKDQVDKV